MLIVLNKKNATYYTKIKNIFDILENKNYQVKAQTLDPLKRADPGRWEQPQRKEEEELHKVEIEMEKS